MNVNLNYLMMALIATLISCERNVLNEIPVKFIQEPVFVCCEDMSAWEGTICCISGENRVDPGGRQIYEYGNNLQDPEIHWQVVSGAMKIADGQYTSSVMVEFGDNFTEGTIKATGTSSAVCEKEFRISRKIDNEMVCGQNLNENNGRIACFYGSEMASPGDTLTYTWESTLNNPDILWKVNDGSIRLIEGENSESATFVFENDFTEGVIKIYGMSRAFPECESYTCFIEVSSP